MRLFDVNLYLQMKNGNYQYLRTLYSELSEKSATIKVEYLNRKLPKDKYGMWIVENGQAFAMMDDSR